MDTTNKFIVFLDIDGVLNTKHSQKKWISRQLPWSDKFVHSYIEWNDNAVFLLNVVLDDIRKHKEVLIVLSSDWRIENSEESNRELFNRYGLQQYESVTPTMKEAPDTHGVRGLEILWWLDKYAPGNPHYLVIDDRKSIMGDHIDNKNFVFVNGGWHGKGFSRWHKAHAIEKARRLLGVE